MTEISSRREGDLAPPNSLARRSLPLLLAALLLAATASFHLTGLAMVSGWFDGERRTVMILLWIAPAASWLLIAAYWLLAWARRAALDWASLLLTALIPLLVGVPLLALVSPVHPGGYMLVGSALLALFSGRAGR